MECMSLGRKKKEKGGEEERAEGERKREQKGRGVILYSLQMLVYIHTPFNKN